MYKSLIAGVTAASLALTPAAPAQANGFSEDNIGKLILGLMAVAGIATVLDQNRSTAGSQSQATTDQTLPNPSGPRMPRLDGYPAAPMLGNHRPAIRIPARCVDRVTTGHGSHRIVDRRCVRRTTNLSGHLPRGCSIRIWTNQGVRSGWDPACLRAQGIRISRRR